MDIYRGLAQTDNLYVNSIPLSQVRLILLPLIDSHMLRVDANKRSVFEEAPRRRPKHFLLHAHLVLLHTYTKKDEKAAICLLERLLCFVCVFGFIGAPLYHGSRTSNGNASSGNHNRILPGKKPRNGCDMVEVNR